MDLRQTLTHLYDAAYMSKQPVTRYSINLPVIAAAFRKLTFQSLPDFIEDRLERFCTCQRLEIVLTYIYVAELICLLRNFVTIFFVEAIFDGRITLRKVVFRKQLFKIPFDTFFFNISFLFMPEKILSFSSNILFTKVN